MALNSHPKTRNTPTGFLAHLRGIVGDDLIPQLGVAGPVAISSDYSYKRLIAKLLIMGSWRAVRSQRGHQTDDFGHDAF